MTVAANQSAREKLIRAKNGDQQAREELVSENIPLVKYIVKRYLNRGAEYDDLFQYGCMGLLKAIERFDPDYPVQFSTYAVPVIMGEIRRYLRDDGPIHISRTIHDLARRIEEFNRQFRQSEQREPSIGEISRALSLDSGDVLLALNSRSRVRSLDEPVKEEGDLRLMDVLGTEPMAQVDRRLVLNKLLRDLTEQERTLIIRRYFHAHTQSSIARDMGISQVQVSRMEAKILKRMRKNAGETS